MKNFLRRGAILAIACRAVAFCVGGSIFGLIAPEPHSFAKATLLPSQQKGRVLTFADRVAYQYAIEEVYWRHRIWPKENPRPKPSLDEVMSRAEVERKVGDYLRNSQALEDYWQRPITPEQLQAEMERMASHTRQPDVLREIFAALGNDPFVIAECLARPVLAERILAEGKTNREAITTFWPSAVSNIARGAADPPDAAYKLPEVSVPTDCTDDTWTPTSTTNAPARRYYHTAVWTGSEMIVWGGYDDEGTGTYLNTGGRYDPATDSWTATTIVNAPSGRQEQTAVWTGSEMIVWGGEMQGPPFVLNTGGRYNPSTNSWTVTNTVNAPAARYHHTAVWSGSEMIVWGGSTIFSYFNTGGKYNPAADSWMATTTVNAPSIREDHTAVWTGNEMIVWGGYNGGIGGGLNTGARYNPVANSWTTTSTTNAPSAREIHTAVWSGSEMIIWGGSVVNGEDLSTGGRYDPTIDSWLPTSTTNAPSARDLHTTIWTGSEMIIWGGRNGSFPAGFNTGGRYDPNTDTWTATSTTNAPGGRFYHTAVWAGSEMIVWGGGGFGSSSNSGGRYCAQSQTPVVTSSFSQKTHGSAGDFYVDLPLSGTPGIECRTGGATSDYTMVVTFGGNVTVTGNPQAEVTLGTGCVGSGGACSGNVSVSGNTVTIPLTNIANAQTINVRLNDVNNAAADAPATDFTIPISILIGDTNANGAVSISDVAQTKGRIGQTLDATNFRSDVNTSGGINSSDVTLIKQHLP